MKKLLFTLLSSLLLLPASAQTHSGDFSFSESSVYCGVRFGLNFSGISGDHIDVGSKTGLNLGGVVGLCLNDDFPIFLESGLLYTECGGKRDKMKISLTYFEIPLLVKCGLLLNDDVALLPFIGPTFRYGIAGRMKEPGVSAVSSYGTGRYKHGDVGIKFGCGMEYNMLYAEMGYQFGVTNIYKNPSDAIDELSQHGHNFFINIGVNF